MPGKLIHDVALAFTGIRIQILLFRVFFFRFSRHCFFCFRFRAAYGFQFGNGLRIERSEPFAFRFETLYADETFRINFLWVAETVVPAERDLQPWIGFVREQDEAAVLVFSHETMGLGTRFERKTLDVRITLLGGIVENGTPYLVR